MRNEFKRLWVHMANPKVIVLPRFLLILILCDLILTSIGTMIGIPFSKVDAIFMLIDGLLLAYYTYRPYRSTITEKSSCEAE